MANGKSAARSDPIEFLQSVEEFLLQMSAIAVEAEQKMLSAQSMFDIAQEQHRNAMDEICAAQKVKIQCLRDMKKEAETEYEALKSPLSPTSSE